MPDAAGVTVSACRVYKCSRLHVLCLLSRIWNQNYNFVAETGIGCKIQLQSYENPRIIRSRVDVPFHVPFMSRYALLAFASTNRKGVINEPHARCPQTT